MSTYTCKLCGITMPVENQLAHLAGIDHARSLYSKGSGISSKERATQTWTCKTCNYTIPTHSVASHRAGSQHLSNLKAEGKTKDTTLAQKPTVIRLIPATNPQINQQPMASRQRPATMRTSSGEGQGKNLEVQKRKSNKQFTGKKMGRKLAELGGDFCLEGKLR